MARAAAKNSAGKNISPQPTVSAGVPLLKTVEQMAVLSGIGENRLRTLMDKHELEYVQNGNRRLLTDRAIMDWYERSKTPAMAASGAGRG